MATNPPPGRPSLPDDASNDPLQPGESTLAPQADPQADSLSPAAITGNDRTGGPTVIETQRTAENSQAQIQPEAGLSMPGLGASAQGSNFLQREAAQYPEIAQGFEAPTSAIASNATKLDASAWREILEINQLLHGFQIRQENQDVVRARKNAFELLEKPGVLPENQKPCFQVEDDTLVEVYETKNDLQRSLARNAFSKRSIETNLSAGDFGVDVGPVWKREGEKATMADVWTETKDQEYYAAYIYARARLFLDEDELKLSETCKAELAQLRSSPTYENLQKFYKRFGHVFVTSVLLGGQQKTTKFAGSSDSQNNAKRQDAIRWAVGAKVNAPYANVGVQYGREKGSGDSEADKEYTRSSYLALSATGGNTLVGSDIPKWAPTIEPFENWRVVKNEIALPIQELIGLMDGYKDIPRLFRQIHEQRPSRERPWKGSFSLWIGATALAWDKKARRLVLQSAKDESLEKAVFRAFSPTTSGATNIRPLDSLMIDTPFSMRSSFSDAGDTEVQVERGNSLQWVVQPGADAARVPYRFSLRYCGTSGAWNPSFDSASKLASGDEVNLYCHSLGLGPYANLRRPPTHASPAIYGPVLRTKTTHSAAGPMEISAVAGIPLGFSETMSYKYSVPCLHFPVPPESLPESAKALMSAYDAGSMQASEKEAFEKMGLISTRTFCPGPIVEPVPESARSMIVGIDISPNIAALGAGAIGGYERTSYRISPREEWSRVDGKKYRIDYLQLQKVPALKNASLDWDRCRAELLGSAGYPGDKKDPTAFRIMFE